MTTVLTEVSVAYAGPASSPRMKVRMLAHMAEALEDQISALYLRAATFEEEEFLANREIEEQQTEINRLLLKLEVIRADRDRVLEKIDSISREAAAIREKVFEGEEQAALAAIEDRPSIAPTAPGLDRARAAFNCDDPAHGANYFRHATPSEQMPAS